MSYLAWKKLKAVATVPGFAWTVAASQPLHPESIDAEKRKFQEENPNSLRVLTPEELNFYKQRSDEYGEEFGLIELQREQGLEREKQKTMPARYAITKYLILESQYFQTKTELFFKKISEDQQQIKVFVQKEMEFLESDNNQIIAVEEKGLKLVEFLDVGNRKLFEEYNNTNERYNLLLRAVGAAFENGNEEFKNYKRELGTVLEKQLYYENVLLDFATAVYRLQLIVSIDGRRYQWSSFSRLKALLYNSPRFQEYQLAGTELIKKEAELKLNVRKLSSKSEKLNKGFLSNFKSLKDTYEERVKLLGQFNAKDKTYDDKWLIDIKTNNGMLDNLLSALAEGEGEIKRTSRELRAQNLQIEKATQEMKQLVQVEDELPFTKAQILSEIQLLDQKLENMSVPQNDSEVLEIGNEEQIKLRKKYTRKKLKLQQQLASIDFYTNREKEKKRQKREEEEKDRDAKRMREKELRQQRLEIEQENKRQEQKQTQEQTETDNQEKDEDLDLPDYNSDQNDTDAASVSSKTKEMDEVNPEDIPLPESPRSGSVELEEPTIDPVAPDEKTTESKTLPERPETKQDSSETTAATEEEGTEDQPIDLTADDDDKGEDAMDLTPDGLTEGNLTKDEVEEEQKDNNEGDLEAPKIKLESAPSLDLQKIVNEVKSTYLAVGVERQSFQKDVEEKKPTAEIEVARTRLLQVERDYEKLYIEKIETVKNFVDELTQRMDEYTLLVLQPFQNQKDLDERIVATQRLKERAEEVLVEIIGYKLEPRQETVQTPQVQSDPGPIVPTTNPEADVLRSVSDESRNPTRVPAPTVPQMQEEEEEEEDDESGRGPIQELLGNEYDILGSKGDGYCLYTSIARGLLEDPRSVQSTDTILQQAKKLKKSALVAIWDPKQEKEGIFAKLAENEPDPKVPNKKLNIIEYVRKQGRKGAWGTTIEAAIIAAQKNVNIDIYVVESTEGRLPYFKLKESITPGTAAATISGTLDPLPRRAEKSILLLNSDNVHFDLLLPKLDTNSNTTATTGGPDNDLGLPNKKKTPEVTNNENNKGKETILKCTEFDPNIIWDDKEWKFNFNKDDDFEKQLNALVVKAGVYGRSAELHRQAIQTLNSRLLAIRREFTKIQRYLRETDKNNKDKELKYRRLKAFETLVDKKGKLQRIIEDIEKGQKTYLQNVESLDQLTESVTGYVEKALKGLERDGDVVMAPGGLGKPNVQSRPNRRIPQNRNTLEKPDQTLPVGPGGPGGPTGPGDGGGGFPTADTPPQYPKRGRFLLVPEQPDNKLVVQLTMKQYNKLLNSLEKIERDQWNFKERLKEIMRRLRQRMYRQPVSLADIGSDDKDSLLPREHKDILLKAEETMKLAKELQNQADELKRELEMEDKLLKSGVTVPLEVLDEQDQNERQLPRRDSMSGVINSLQAATVNA